MNNRKRYVIVLLAILIAVTAILAGCDNNAIKAEPIMHEGKQIIIDPNFSNGFNVRGLSSMTDGAKVFGKFDYGNSALEPKWTFSQWWAKESILDGGAEKLRDGSWRYYDSTKELTVNVKAGLLKQKVVASKNYDAPRRSNEMWIHELCELTLAGNFLSDREKLADYRLADMKELWFTGRFKLTCFVDYMGEEAVAGMHAAQYTCFINMQNLNNNPEKDAGFDTVMHFGLPIFDNRREYTSLYAAKDATSQNYIYSLASDEYMSSSFFKDGAPYGSEDNEWITIDVDILPYLKKAFDRAKRSKAMSETDWEELYVGALSVGWEVPGTYDVEMWVKDLALYAVK